MKSRIPVGTVIARRTLVDAKSSARIVVSIGAPVFIGDGWDWACPYRINGLRKTLFGHAHGIDGIQAFATCQPGYSRCAWKGPSAIFCGLINRLGNLDFPSWSLELESRRSNATSKM